jgi:hypothetical protein
MAGSFRNMEAQSLTKQAQQAGEKIKQDIPSQYRGELKSIVDELTGRVDFVAVGQPPRTKTNYQSLEASALAQQARHVISQISRNIPVEKRESLEIIETLADRVEFAAVGSPSSVGGTSATRATSRRTPTRRRTTSRTSTSRPSGAQPGTTPRPGGVPRPGGTS